MSSFTDVFGGSNIYSSDVSFLALALTANTTLEWPISRSQGADIAARIIEVTPTAAYAITLPDATLVGKGETILFNNRGPYTITIKDASGTTLGTIADGQVWQYYLSSNSSAAGTWRTFQYGVGTSAATAASLVGYGLKAVSATLAQSMMVNTFNSNYTIGAPDRSSLYVWTGAVGTLALPSASSVGNDFFVSVRNGGTGNLTVDPSSTETVNDATTLVLLPGDSIILVTDGTEWFTVGLGQDAVFAFDFTSIDLTGQASPYTLSGSELNRISYKFIGVLTANIVIIVPTTVQQYWVDNRTTGGSYTLSLKTATQVAAIGVTRNARGIYYCDGADVVNADTASISTPIGISDGGTSGTTQASARTGLGATSVGAAVFIAANEAAGRTAITAAKSGANTDITDLALSGNQTITGTLGVTGAVSFGGTASLIGTINTTHANGPYFAFQRSGSALGDIGSAKAVIGSGALADFGITSRGANNLIFGANTTEAARIDSNGLFGVNTTPAIRMHINGAGTDETLRVQATASPAATFYQGAATILGSVQGTTSGMALTANSTRYIIFQTNGSERMRIDSAGLITAKGQMNFDNDTGFSLYKSGGNPTLVVDTNDYFYYDRASNFFSFNVGTAQMLTVDATGPKAATAAQDTATTQLATTAFVDRMRNIPRSTTTTTAAIGDRGKCIAITANIDIPNAVFAAGDTISIYNDSAGALTITQGASFTLRLAGTATTGNRTLAARGFATIWFNTASEGICNGPGVT